MNSVYRDLSLGERIVLLREKVGHIAKENSNDSLRYSYRGYEVVYAHVRPVMDELGIYIDSTFVEQVRSRSVEMGRNKTEHQLVEFVYTINLACVGRDEKQTHQCAVGNYNTGIAQAYGGAMSYAMRYIITTVFLIPTEEIEDADATHGRDVSRPVHSQVKPSLYHELREKITATNDRQELIDILHRVVEDKKKLDVDNPKAFSLLAKMLEKKGLKV